MRIYYISDIHYDMHNPNNFVPIPDDKVLKASVAVIAGDINTGSVNSVKLVADVLQYYANKFYEVVFVPGNHDFYHQDIHKYGSELRAELNKRRIGNVYVLNGIHRHVNINGVWFFGDTLWSDLHLGYNDPVYKVGCQMTMPCFANIKEGESQFTVDKMIKLHEEQLYWLKHFLHDGFYKKKVVVTHFSPSMQSMDPRYEFFTYNDYFHNDLDSLIEDVGPNVWIHGHSHHAIDYRLGKTQIVCNPYGYPGQFGRNGYEELKFIEV